MIFDQHEVLRRFHRALVREIHARNPQRLGSPFTVAEIYQDLVPYRTHRAELGVEMNADYEHALLRLLAGEGDFLTIESKTARQEIREELDSPNPNTGLYRDFAAADVRLSPDKLDPGLLVVEPATTAEEEEPMDEDLSMGETPSLPGERLEVEPFGASLVPAAAGEALEEVLDSSESLHEVSEQEPDAPSANGAEDREDLSAEDDLPFENCPWCREKLPQRPGVRFCPFCGSNVRLVPCPACGEELELNWRFCVACGTEVAS
jgi:hypothetical protein